MKPLTMTAEWEAVIRHADATWNVAVVEPLAARDRRALLAEIDALRLERDSDLASVTAERNHWNSKAERLDARDAQEGDRIAAWSDWAERPACVRCWYPATTHPHDEGLCHRCSADDDRDAAGAVEVAT